MKTTKSLGISTLIGVVTSISFGATGQITNNKAASDPLERQVIRLQVEHHTTTSAVMRALSDASVPGGMVKAFRCEDREVEHDWSPQSAPLREVLDSIIQEDAKYKWDVDSGVVNVVPVGGEPELLRVRIKEFRVKNATQYEALIALRALPEVQAAIVRLHLSEGLYAVSILTTPNPRTFDLDCQDVTLRQALDAIVRAHGRAVWTYSQSSCHGRIEFWFGFLVG